MAKANVRIPLQLGNSAVLGRLRASVLLLPSIVCIVAWIAIPGWLGSLDDGVLGTVLGLLGFIPGLVVAVLALAGTAFAAEGAGDARKQAPSDLELTGTGVRVHGGPEHGKTLHWGELAGAVVEKNETSEAGAILRFVAAILRMLRLTAVAERIHADAHELRVGTRVLGIAVRDDEVESLRLLAQTLAELGKQRITPKEDDAANPSAPEVIGCPSCGTPATPADAASVLCRSCGTAVEMPTELRERIRAHEHVAGAARLERVIARVLQQPGAEAAGRWLQLGSFAMRLGWPLALATLGTLVVMHAGDNDALPRMVLARPAPLPWARDFALAGALAAMCFVGVAIGLDAYFANRRALRLVTFDFGATPPTAKAGWSCRVCAAPLPASERLLVRCAYCAAENVLGLDLRVRSARARDQAGSVADALRHRRRSRIRLVVVMLGLLAGAGWLGHELRYTFYAALPRPERSIGCYSCPYVELHNRDGVRHPIELVGEKDRRMRVVPAHASVQIECEYRCEVRLGTQSYALDRRVRLAIDGGWLVLDDSPPQQR
jgi:hypothetical protein